MRSTRLLRHLGMLMLVALVACAEEPGEPAGDQPESTAPVVAPSTTVAEPAPEAGDAADAETSTTPPPSVPLGDPVVEAREVATLDRPVRLVTRPGDSGVYALEQAGAVVRIDPATGAVDEVADLRDLTAAEGERGLLGLVFSADGMLAYANHTDLDGDTVVAEYAVEPDGRWDLATRRELITIDQPYGNHNGGHLEIGPDEMLYIGMGDGGSADDPQRFATDLSSPLGALLRIDPEPGSDGQYGIPADNPYLTVPGARPELFAVGLRNPWYFGFDPVTGDLWVADVGQNAHEELNVVRASGDDTVAGAGVHFGWSAYEGFERRNDDVQVDEHHEPSMVYPHGDEGCSISGGAVYRGSEIAGLRDAFVLGDYCSGRVWAFDPTSGRRVELVRLERITSIAAGPDGELWVASHDGPIRRLEPGG